MSVEEAETWVESNHVSERLTDAINAAIAALPEDPLKFMVSYISSYGLSATKAAQRPLCLCAGQTPIGECRSGSGREASPGGRRDPPA